MRAAGGRVALPCLGRGALRGTPGSACPQPEPNATELPSYAPISARAAQRRRRRRWWRGEEGVRRPAPLSAPANATALPALALHTQRSPHLERYAPAAHSTFSLFSETCLRDNQVRCPCHFARTIVTVLRACAASRWQARRGSDTGRPWSARGRGRRRRCSTPTPSALSAFPPSSPRESEPT